MWKTLIEVQAGLHVPYFPGMDWDKVEGWKDSGKGMPLDSLKTAHIERNKKRGLRTRVLVLETVQRLKLLKTPEVSHHCKISKSTAQKVLHKLYTEGLINRETVTTVKSNGGKTYFWTAI